MAKRMVEYSMYILYTVALLPMAVFEGHNLIFFLTHPSSLVERDAAIEVTAVVWALHFAFYLLVPTVILAIFFFIVGPRQARINIAVLLGALILWLCFGGFFAFNSWGNLLSSSIPLFLLLLLSIAFFIRRLRSAKPADL